MKRFFCMFLMAMLLLAGCTAEQIDDSAFMPITRELMDAVLDADFDRCRALMTQQVSDESLREGIAQVSSQLDGVENYTLKPVAWETKTINGITQSSVRYEMQTEIGRYYVDVMLVEDVDGLAGFHLSPITVLTGTLGSMEGAGLMQWLVLVLGFAEFGFVLWMAIDCLRNSFKGKVGWLLLILLISGLITLTFGPGKFYFNVNGGIYLYLSALLKDSAGTTVFRLYVPIGALIYYFRRGKLHSRPKEEQTTTVLPEADIVPETES